jgi:hypothetical protein
VLELVHPVLQATAPTLDFVPQARLHLLQLLQHEFQSRIHGFVHSRPARVVVRKRLHESNEYTNLLVYEKEFEKLDREEGEIWGGGRTPSITECLL